MGMVTHGLRDLPLHQKLTLIAMVTSGGALVIAIVILAAYDLITSRAALQRDVATGASVVGQNSTAAISFQDRDAATQNLTTFRAKPNIRAACIYDESGKLFASYAVPPYACPASQDLTSTGFSYDELREYRQIVLAGKPIGAIYIESSLDELRTRLKAQTVMFVVVLLVSALTAYLISSRLQRLISTPLLSLSDTARKVSRDNDFSLRAKKETNDEVGQLVDTFNHMLEQISEYDAQRRDLLKRERRARSEAEEAARRSALLAEASRILSSSLDVRETVGAMARHAASVLSAWCIIDVQHEGSLLRLEAVHSDPVLHEHSTSLLNQPRANLDPKLPVSQVIATGKPVSGEFTADMLRKSEMDETRLAFIRSMELKSFVIVPLITQGRVLGALTFISPSVTKYSEADIRTAEQLADRLAVALDNSRLYNEVRTSDRLKDEFLATMSHELRTPLTAIVGWARMLKGGRLSDEKQARAVEVIDRNAEFETRLVEDILDASRMISGKFDMEFEFVDLADVLQSAVDSIRPSAHAKNLELTTRFEATPRVWGNGKRLQQVFGNLLANSVKFTPPAGAITVVLTARGSSAEIRVSDTGIGIRPEFLSHVFERFRQEDSSSTRKYGGLGLGLAIVRHLVELHGGRISVESPGPGLGSTFLISLPVTRDHLTDSAPAESRTSLQGRLNGIHALIVEDESDTRELMATIIEQEGGLPQTADSYSAAMALLADFTPDVLLIDIGMPLQDGYALIKAARDLPQLKYTPAIAVTAYASEADRDTALRASFHAHVAKPFSPSALIDRIADLVYQRL